MEEDISTTTNHFYEQNQCSGMFVYSIDNCEPSYIKFSARITIRVIYNNDLKHTNPNVGNSNELIVASNNSYFDVISKNHLQQLPGTELFIDSDENEEKNTAAYANNNVSQQIAEGNQVQSDLVCNSLKDLSPADDEDFEMLHMDAQSLENSSARVYNLRQKSGKLINEDDGLFKDEENLSEEKRPVKGDKINRRGKKKDKGKQLRNRSKKSKEDDIETNSCNNKEVRDENKPLVKQRKKDMTTKTKSVSESESESENSLKDNTRRAESNRKARPRKLLMEKDVTCNYCGVTFETKLDFFNHRRNKGSSFKCKECGKDEPFEAHLMVHKLSHEPEKGLVEEKLEKEGELKKRRFKMKCNVCGLVVSSVDSLKVHMILHTGECPYRCCLCEDQQFFSLSSLRHHQEVHRISQRFQCKICSMRFSSRTELSKHKLTHEIKCGLCGELFPNKTSRSCHYRVAHPKDIKKCKECYSLFSTDEELEKHIIYHRKGKKEQCPECGVVVTKLKDHMILHSRKEGENMFACDQCPMKYKRKSTLEKHLLIHTGERPYACNKCPKRFRSNGMLRKHLLTHTLEKPFVCEVCGKQCSVRSNLVTHMRIHAETRKYPCTLCFQAFNYKTSLDIHMKCKHNNTQETSSFVACLHCSQHFKDESSLTTHIINSHPETKSNKEVRQEQPVPLPTIQEPTYITQDPPMMSFNYPEQSHPCQTPINPHIPTMQNPTMHSILNLDKNTTLEAVSNFPVQTSSIHIGNNLTASNMDSFERTEMLSYFGRDRMSPLPLQNSILSVPPTFQYMPQGLEQLPHSINYSGMPIVGTSEKTATESNNLERYDNNTDLQGPFHK